MNAHDKLINRDTWEWIERQSRKACEHYPEEHMMEARVRAEALILEGYLRGRHGSSTERVGTFHAFEDEVCEWNTKNFPDNTADQMLKGVVEELGELAHADLKHEQGISGMTDHAYDKAALDAIGDMLVYLSNYCRLRGLSLLRAVNTAMRDIKKRDYQKFPKTGGREDLNR